MNRPDLHPDLIKRFLPPLLEAVESALESEGLDIRQLGDFVRSPTLISLMGVMNELYADLPGYYQEVHGRVQIIFELIYTWIAWVKSNRQVYRVSPGLTEAIKRSVTIDKIPAEHFYLPFQSQYLLLPSGWRLHNPATGEHQVEGVYLMEAFGDAQSAGFDHLSGNIRFLIAFVAAREGSIPIEYPPGMRNDIAMDDQTFWLPTPLIDGKTIGECFDIAYELKVNRMFVSEEAAMKDLREILSFSAGAMSYATATNSQIVEEITAAYGGIRKRLRRLESSGRANRAKRERERLYEIATNRKLVLGPHLKELGNKDHSDREGSDIRKPAYVPLHVQGYWALEGVDTHPNAPRKLSSAGNVLALITKVKEPYWKNLTADGPPEEGITRRVLT